MEVGYWCYNCSSMTNPSGEFRCTNCDSDFLEERVIPQMGLNFMRLNSVHENVSMISSRLSVLMGALQELLQNTERNIYAGMNDQEIDQIETVSNLPELCAICAEELTESVKKLQCTHCFHDKCLRPWLKAKSTCPTCRSSARV